MSGGKTVLIGLGLILVGLLWTLIPGGWADLWRVIKGGVSLFLFFASLITLLMGYFQFREEHENQRREEEDKRLQEEQRAVAG